MNPETTVEVILRLIITLFDDKVTNIPEGVAEFRGHGVFLESGGDGGYADALGEFKHETLNSLVFYICEKSE